MPHLLKTDSGQLTLHDTCVSLFAHVSKLGITPYHIYVARDDPNAVAEALAYGADRLQKLNDIQNEAHEYERLSWDEKLLYHKTGLEMHTAAHDAANELKSRRGNF